MITMSSFQDFHQLWMHLTTEALYVLRHLKSQLPKDKSVYSKRFWILHRNKYLIIWSQSSSEMCRNVRRFHRHLKKHAMNLHPMLQGDWWMSLGISSTAPTNGLTLQVNTFPLFWSGGCKHSFIKTEISVTLALHINDDRQISMENIYTERPTRRAWPAHLTHLQCSAIWYAVSSLADWTMAHIATKWTWQQLSQRPTSNWSFADNESKWYLAKSWQPDNFDLTSRKEC